MTGLDKQLTMDLINAIEQANILLHLLHRDLRALMI